LKKSNIYPPSSWSKRKPNTKLGRSKYKQTKGDLCLPNAYWFLVWLTDQLWKWRWCIPPECLAISELHGVTTQKIHIHCCVKNSSKRVSCKLQVSCVAYSLTLKMEAIYSPRTSSLFPTTQHYNVAVCILWPVCWKPGINQHGQSNPTGIENTLSTTPQNWHHKVWKSLTINGQ
jgi:hypothetical protein